MPKSDSRAPAASEDDEERFRVRDLLTWSANDDDAARSRRALLRGPRGPSRPSTSFKFDAVSVFYVFCALTLLAVAELLMKPHLEKAGTDLILQMQRANGDAYITFFDAVGFPPDVWGFLPAVALAAVPSWRDVSRRALLLQGSGAVAQWLLLLVFQQARPFWLDARVKMWHCPTTFGFPSGHALLLLLLVAPVVEELWARHSALAALPAASALLGLYAACVVGRMYLGTHFPHDLAFGALLAMLLLQLLSKRNAQALAGRVSASVMRVRDGDRMLAGVEALLRGAGTAALFWALSRGILAAHLRISGEHVPKAWTERALAHCPLGPDPWAGSLGKLDDGAAVLVGWIVAVSLTQVSSSAAQAPSSSQYGALDSDGKAIAGESTTEERGCATRWALQLGGMAALTAAAWALAFASPWPRVGKAAAVVAALYIYRS